MHMIVMEIMIAIANKAMLEITERSILRHHFFLYTAVVIVSLYLCTVVSGALPDPVFLFGDFVDIEFLAYVFSVANELSKEAYSRAMPDYGHAVLSILYSV